MTEVPVDGRWGISFQSTLVFTVDKRSWVVHVSLLAPVRWRTFVIRTARCDCIYYVTAHSSSSDSGTSTRPSAALLSRSSCSIGQSCVQNLSISSRGLQTSLTVQRYDLDCTQRASATLSNEEIGDTARPLIQGRKMTEAEEHTGSAHLTGADEWTSYPTDSVTRGRPGACSSEQRSFGTVDIESSAVRGEWWSRLMRRRWRQCGSRG